jgi:hypothetical protein
MGVLRAMLGGDLTGPPRSYALRRRARHAPGRAMAFAARAAGQGASLLSSPPRGPIAEIVLRHGPVERHALARPSSSDRPESGRRLLQPRRPALTLAEYPKRIAKTGLSRGPETYRRNGGGPSRQGRLWAVATAANSPHGLRLCGEHGANVGYTPRFW